MTRGRKACRGGHPCEPRTFAEALYCLVQHSDIEPEQLAARLGKRVGYILDASNPDRDETKFQAELIVPAMLATNNLAPLHFLCSAFNGVFQPLPPTDCTQDQILTAFARAVSEVGQTGDAILRGFDDARFTPDDARKAVKELDESMQAFANVRALLVSRYGGGQ